MLHPYVQLSANVFKGAEQGWKGSPNWLPDTQSGTAHMMARGRMLPVLVVSESCELDKKESKARVSVAPVYPISQLKPEEIEIILSQRRASKMPLPNAPTLGTSYADLRMITGVDRKVLDPARRLAQLSDEGVRRLHAQLVGFYTRLDARELLGIPK